MNPLSKSHPLALGAILEKTLKSFRPKHDMEMLRIFDLWEDAVGESISTNTRPAAFKGDLLLVHVSSSAWMHHLYFQKQELLEKINSALGHDLVRELKFKIGPMKF